MITITTTNENREEVLNNLNHIVKEGGEVIIKNNFGRNKFKKENNIFVKVWQIKLKVLHLSYNSLTNY